MWRPIDMVVKQTSIRSCGLEFGDAGRTTFGSRVRHVDSHVSRYCVQRQTGRRDKYSLLQCYDISGILRDVRFGFLRLLYASSPSEQAVGISTTFQMTF